MVDISKEHAVETFNSLMRARVCHFICGRSGTLLAELGLWRVLMLAPGTLHAGVSQRAGPGTVGQVPGA